MTHPADQTPSIYEHVSEWRLEDIAAWFKKWYESPTHVLEEYPNMQLLVELYHWSDPGMDLSLDVLMNDKSLFLSDNSLSWNINAFEGLGLYRVTATIQKPLALLDQAIPYERLRGDSVYRARLEWYEEKHGRFDAIIYTPHPMLDEPEVRQLELLNPQQAIKNIEYLGISQKFATE